MTVTVDTERVVNCIFFVVGYWFGLTVMYLLRRRIR